MNTFKYWIGKSDIILDRYTDSGKVTNVKCPDGIFRTANVLTADTAFTRPASVQVKGKRVSGFVSIDDGIVCFHQSQTGKNNAIFWNNPDHAQQWIENNIATNPYFTEYHITHLDWQVTLKREHSHGLHWYETKTD